MSKALFEGEAISLSQLLNAKEVRYGIQKQLLESQESAVLLSMTMNVPGPVKTSLPLTKVFEGLIQTVEENLADLPHLHYLYRKEATGLEYYALVDTSAPLLKERLIMIEEKLPLGRLLDLDVLWLAEEQLYSISRQELGFPPRSCFVCGEDAKICGRSRKHPLGEVQEKIVALVKEEGMIT